MIEKLRIQGYRKFIDQSFKVNNGTNIFVGDNESGKSTLLEAIGLVLTGRINGRPAQEELSPFWFNQSLVENFFAERSSGKKVALPTIQIEAFFSDDDKLQKFRGVHNTDVPPNDCPGLTLRIAPNPDFSDEIELFLKKSRLLLPVEYFNIEWKSFADEYLPYKPKEVSVATIDSKTIRSSSGIDYHLRQMLSDNLKPAEKTEIAVAYRAVKEEMTGKHLNVVNQNLAKLKGALDDSEIALAMDQSSRASWDSAVIPHLGPVPFAMAGQGQQAAIKIILAMGRSADSARVAMIEEPENHLSHTSLNKLLQSIVGLASQNQQLFITTHSSYVLNRLGLESLLLISNGVIAPLTGVTPETARYFQKLPGYDTLRVALASKLVLVEGPSDEILFEAFYLKTYGKRPIENGIDVLSVRGLSFKRFLEVAKLLDKKCALIRDLDKNTQSDLHDRYKSLLSAERVMFCGDEGSGKTLEPQIISVNEEVVLRKVLGLTADQGVDSWMTSNKTESALRLSENPGDLVVPKYLADAISFIHA